MHANIIETVSMDDGSAPHGALAAYRCMYYSRLVTVVSNTVPI